MENKYNLVGSEKQIKWGTDILNKIFDKVNHIIERDTKVVNDIKTALGNDAKSVEEKELKGWIKAKEMIEEKFTSTEAKFVIENRNSLDITVISRLAKANQ